MDSNQINIDRLMSATAVRFGTSGIRGLVENMTDIVCYAYVSAFLKLIADQSKPLGRVLLGHDLRPSSPDIAKACSAAIIDAGGEVIYAGALPTPALASYALFHHLPVIVVTGSHIPFDRNGIKFYRAEGEISKADELAIQNAVVEVPEKLACLSLPQIDVSAEEHYIRRYVEFFGVKQLKGMRIASYEHSSVARDVLRKILEALGVEVITLGRTESFVPIDTEAVRPEDVLQAKAWAQEYDFDAIFSTDGDADRPLIGDEQGQWLRGDVVGILCAKYLAADAAVTPVSSNSLVEKSSWFRQVVRTRIGSPYVIAGMDQILESQPSDVVVGFEANGGFLLGSDIVKDGKVLSVLPTRDAVLPMLAVLYLAKELKFKVSELVASLPNRYTASDRLQNFPIEQSVKLINLLQLDDFQSADIMAPNSGGIVSVDVTDGFRATFSNGDIVHLRPSGNAPELRCYAESDTQSKAQALCKQCLALVSAYEA